MDAETAKMAWEQQSHKCAAKSQLCHTTTKAERGPTWKVDYNGNRMQEAEDGQLL